MAQGVKSVTDDLEGAMERWLCWAQSTMGLNELCNLADSSEASRVLSGRESAMVTSSAYEVLIMAGVEQSAVKKLKSDGERTAPWGTPLWMMRCRDVADRY